MVPIKRILVPTDFSEPAAAAVRWAVTLARQFDSQLVLLHVIPEPYSYPWAGELSTFPNDILTQIEKAAEGGLLQVAADAGMPEGRVVTRSAIGAPVDQILSVIGEDKIDMVVIGTHGRGMVGHLLLGSVAERVVRRSPVPVLTVHGDARNAELKKSA